ncbi:hypothetical protein CTI12_AA378320 [Artemisia annua]|uniref:Reverse transcriptase domain-containing protein n=1 Tax=Artemisia annua TaxID=35608 RepID=A0A2U1MHS6_ARTAN|nr:hypothetical protein CTI12_AA378320 [Artemisia annua]
MANQTETCKCYVRFLVRNLQKNLESFVSYDEIKRAVWDCGTNKSPGPDGFSFDFIRKFWNIINENVVAAITDFISLIPKIQDAKAVKDFHPISLIESMYKITANIMANRLSLVIHDIISDVQSAFVSNRQILDGPFILNELLSWCKYKKSKALIFKVDFEKAFDSVRWDYLNDVLISFGFGQKWRSCIDGSLNSIWDRFLSTEHYISQFITAIHGSRGALDGTSSAPRTSPWLDVIQVLSSLKSKDIDLLGFTKKKMGNGEKTLFWDDLWIGEDVLKSYFPRLFVLETRKYISVSVKMSHSSLDFSFHRLPREGVEEEQFCNLISCTSAFILPQIEDRWVWFLSSTGDFSVNSTRYCIDDKLLPRFDSQPDG